MGQVQRMEDFVARSRTDTLRPKVPRIVPREDVAIKATISVAGRARAITLINLSSHGFMGECPAGVPLRSRVNLDLPGMSPLGGCVRWAVGRRVGGRFDTPLDEAQLAAAMAAAFA